LSSTNINTSIADTTRLDYINIGLMIVSLVAAYILPFEVFLFSYAVLGPLHYLTEISWLEKKNYFVKNKKDVWLFVPLVALITIGMFYQQAKVNSYLASIMFVALLYALAILFIEKRAVKIGIVAVAFLLSLIFSFNKFPNISFILLAIWVPTIIHVFVFTGAFILFGALKNRSVSGILSLAVFVACAISFFIYMPANEGLATSNYAVNAYKYFKVLNASLYHAFGFGEFSMNDEIIFHGPQAFAIMRFIAFAYTYHYLNWFSKTTVIKWNQVSQKRMNTIILLWVLSVALYAVSYEIGFYALFLLSMLHVFFEFPLNHFTFIGIGKELKNLVKNKRGF
jgi:hypothetical protein